MIEQRGEAHRARRHDAGRPARHARGRHGGRRRRRYAHQARGCRRRGGGALALARAGGGRRGGWRRDARRTARRSRRAEQGTAPVARRRVGQPQPRQLLPSCRRARAQRPTRRLVALGRKSRARRRYGGGRRGECARAAGGSRWSLRLLGGDKKDKRRGGRGEQGGRGGPRRAEPRGHDRLDDDAAQEGPERVRREARPRAGGAEELSEIFAASGKKLAAQMKTSEQAYRWDELHEIIVQELGEHVARDPQPARPARLLVARRRTHEASR